MPGFLWMVTLCLFEKYLEAGINIPISQYKVPVGGYVRSWETTHQRHRQTAKTFSMFSV